MFTQDSDITAPWWGPNSDCIGSSRLFQFCDWSQCDSTQLMHLSLFSFCYFLLIFLIGSQAAPDFLFSALSNLLSQASSPPPDTFCYSGLLTRFTLMIFFFFLMLRLLSYFFFRKIYMVYIEKWIWWLYREYRVIPILWPKAMWLPLNHFQFLQVRATDVPRLKEKKERRQQAEATWSVDPALVLSVYDSDSNEVQVVV